MIYLEVQYIQTTIITHHDVVVHDPGPPDVRPALQPPLQQGKNDSPRPKEEHELQHLHPKKVHLFPHPTHLKRQAEGAQDGYAAVDVEGRVDGNVDVAPVAALVELGELRLDGVGHHRGSLLFGTFNVAKKRVNNPSREK